MKSFKVYDKQPVDLIILDENGAKWLRYCLPKSSSFVVLKNRDIFPVIKSFSFLLLFTKFFVMTRRPRVSSLSAIISILSPNVVITFIDNYSGLGEIQTLFPDKKIIAVQNSMRNKWGMNQFIKTLKPSKEGRNNGTDLPIYFGYGKHEKHLFDEYSLTVKKYIPIGSIKMSIFHTFFNKDVSRKKGIRFVSQYRKNIEQSNNKISVNYYKVYKKILQNIFKFAKNNNIDFSIILVGENGQAKLELELKYYDNIFGYNNVDYLINDSNNLSSYKHCFDSSLIVTMNSSLGFEFFGNGSKVLFCNTSDNILLNGFQEEKLYDKIPIECLLFSTSYLEISNKILGLLDINEKKYALNIKKSTNYYMSNANVHSPLINLKKFISDSLNIKN